MPSEACDGGMLVPSEAMPFINEILKRGGCIIHYKPVALNTGCCLLPPAAMPIERIEWLDGSEAQK